MKKLFFGFFLLLICGFMIFLVYSRKDTSTNSPNFSALKFKFIPGEESAFDLYQNTIISFKNEGKTESATNLDLKGTLIKRVYKVKDNLVILGIKIKDPLLNLEENKNLENLKRELSREIFLKISPNGKILNFLFPKDYNTEASNIIRSIMSVTQIILPDIIQTKNDLNYQLTELNLNGPLQVEYKILFQEKILIEKTFIKYDFIGLNDVPDSEIIFLPGSKSISILEDGFLTKIDQIENTLVDSQGFQIQSGVKTKISLREKKPFHIPSTEPWNSPQFVVGQIFGVSLSREERKSNIKKELGNLKIETIFDNFNKLNFKTQGKEAYENFRKLKAYLEIYPDQLKKVIDQIEYLDPQDPFYENFLSVYFGAISTMEAEFAQDGLMDVILKNQDSSVQIQAFGALADLIHPTKKTQEFLIDYYKNPFIPESQSLAALSLGTLAYMAKNNSPDLVKETSNFLKDELAKSEKKEDILTLISAIGNSGNASLLEILKPYIESRDQDISSSAVIAMENMTGENVNKIIKDLLGNNALKSNALYVLSKSPSSTYQLELAKSFFEKESDPELKIQALKIISNNSRFFRKEVSEYLERVKSKDSNPKIRNAALDLLISL